MQAVISTGGKQYLVAVGQTLAIDATGTEQQLSFEPLLVIDGDTVQVGAPTVAGITVSAEITGETKGDKLKILKFKPKKRVKKLTGHRQGYIQIAITAIGSERAKAAQPAKAATPAAKAVAAKSRQRTNATT